MFRILFFLPCFFLSVFSSAQESNSNLTLEEIMKGEKFVGALPFGLQWSADAKYLYFQRDTNFDGVQEWFALDTVDWRVTHVAPEKEKEMLIFGNSNRNIPGTLQTWSRDGDIWLFEKSVNKCTRITATKEAETNPHFARHDSLIVFRKSNNLFSWNRMDGTLKQWTDIRDKKALAEPDKDDFYRQQQHKLFEIVRQNDQIAEVQKEIQKKRKNEIARPFYLESRTLRNLTNSASMKYIGIVLETTLSQRTTEMPRYVTESGFTEIKRTRPKVGEEKNFDELLMYVADKDTFVRISLDNLPGIFDHPSYLKDYSGFESKSKDIRQVKIQGPFFHPEEDLCFVVIRSLDNKDRWIAMVDPEKFQLKLIQHDHDDAWIGGPGISSWPGGDYVGWVNDGLTIYFQSEETGFSHLYLYHIENGEKTALTSGNWEVLQVYEISGKPKFYLQANKENPFEQHIYKMDMKSGEMQRITTTAGKYDFFPSPDDKWHAFLFSESTQPTEIIVSDQRGKEYFKSSSVTSAFSAYSWKQPEIVHFTASDGVEVPARLYRSKNTEGGPAVIFVHGAGYLQNVHRWWSTYFREYMFHNMLADEGFTVLDIDYRGSAGYGRDWRTAIYRHMGGRDLQDQVDGAAYLVQTMGIDKDRIGIYGGSYGGFITLMALFNEPDVFKAGAALRSVTDWAHYNQGYTSNILNLPMTDSIAYRRSSPIYFAEGLKNRLLMLHGMEDDNVHFQDIIRLTQRLIELGKENWELALYPVEPHGFREYSSWLDEYRRIYKLFTEELTE